MRCLDEIMQGVRIMHAPIGFSCLGGMPENPWGMNESPGHFNEVHQEPMLPPPGQTTLGQYGIGSQPAPEVNCFGEQRANPYDMDVLQYQRGMTLDGDVNLYKTPNNRTVILDMPDVQCQIHIHPTGDSFHTEGLSKLKTYNDHEIFRWYPMTK